MLHFRADREKREVRHRLLYEGYGVGIAHGYEAEGQVVAVHREWVSQHRRGQFLGQGHWNLGGRQDRSAHGHSRAGDAPPVVGGGYRADAGQRLNGQPVVRRGGDIALDGVLGEAADAVAAHLALRAVGVEHHHLEVSHVGVGDENQPIAADAEMPVAHLARKLGPVMLPVAGVNVYVVVARAFHLGKLHRLGSW